MGRSKQTLERRWQKLYEKLVSESGPRWQNRIEREQKKEAKLKRYE